MKSDGLAIVIALLSAFLFALASVLQQKAAANVDDSVATGGKLLVRLVRRPIWLAGVGLDTLAFLAQAAALAVGSLLIVQPLLVTTLFFALPLGRIITGRAVYASDWMWAVVLTIALGTFITVGNPTNGLDSVPFSRWLPTLVLLGGGTAVSVTVAFRSQGRLRALLLAGTAGMLFGLSSALTKSVVDAFDLPLAEAIPELFKSWETYALAVFISIGFVLQQSAYQAGNLKESLPAMIVLDPVASMAIGVLVLEETLDVQGAFGWIVTAVALVAMFAGTIQLSRSSAVHEAHPV